MKVFLSHSWAQQQFVDEVAKEIGLDFSIVDRFEFESGRKLEEEIDKSIDKSSFFVLLASKEAMESDWCKHELSRVRDFVDEGKIVFMSFRISSNLDINSDLVKPWIRKYLTNIYDNAYFLARVIKRQVNEKLYDLFPSINVRKHIFVGRESDFSEVMQNVYLQMDSPVRCIIASGLNHIGRKRFLQELMNVKMNNSLHPSYEPIDISLQRDESIDMFIRQLNDFLHLYKPDDLLQKMRDTAKQKDLAVEMINKVVSLHELIRVNDDGCIVNNNGYYEDWFLDIIHDENLVRKVSMFVASSYQANPNVVRTEKKVVAHGLNTLTQNELKILFNIYAQSKGVKCDEKGSSELLSYINGYPDQVFYTIDMLAETNYPSTLANMESIQSLYYNDITNVLDRFNDDDESMQLLVLMSRLMCPSFEQLKSILGDEGLIERLHKMQRNGLLENFGVNRQYMRINSALSDYIIRYDIKLKKQYVDALNRYVQKLLKETNLEGLDFADDILRARKILEDNRFKITDVTSILPSVILQVVIDQYRKKEYDNVISLASQILDREKYLAAYESVKRSIRYWMCLSYCRLVRLNGDPDLSLKYKLDAELSNFSGYTKFFLLGYYERNKSNWPMAEKYFEDALKCVQHKSKHTSKAAHELVIVQMKQGRYNDALEKAKENYEIEPNNAYHIDAYFRCLVRDVKANKSILLDLIHLMKKSFDSNKDVMVGVSEAEYQCYIDKNPVAAIKDIKHIIMSNKGKYLEYAYDSLYTMCQRNEMLGVYRDFIKRFPYNH